MRGSPVDGNIIPAHRAFPVARLPNGTGTGSGWLSRSRVIISSAASRLILLAGVTSVTTSAQPRLTSTDGNTGLPQKLIQLLFASIAIEVPTPPTSAAIAPCQLNRIQKRPSIEQMNRPDMIIDIILVI